MADADKPPKPRRFVAVQTHDSRSAGELEFQEGDKILVLEELPGGWYRGQHKGKIGLFKKTYVKEVKRPSKVRTQTGKSGSRNQYSNSKSKSFIRSGLPTSLPKEERFTSKDSSHSQEVSSSALPLEAIQKEVLSWIATAVNAADNARVLSFSIVVVKDTNGQLSYSRSATETRIGENSLTSKRNSWDSSGSKKRSKSEDEERHRGGGGGGGGGGMEWDKQGENEQQQPERLNAASAKPQDIATCNPAERSEEQDVVEEKAPREMGSSENKLASDGRCELVEEIAIFKPQPIPGTGSGEERTSNTADLAGPTATQSQEDTAHDTPAKAVKAEVPVGEDLLATPPRNRISLVIGTRRGLSQQTSEVDHSSAHDIQLARESTADKEAADTAAGSAPSAEVQATNASALEASEALDAAGKNDTEQDELDALKTSALGITKELPIPPKKLKPPSTGGVSITLGGTFGDVPILQMRASLQNVALAETATAAPSGIEDKPRGGTFRKARMEKWLEKKKNAQASSAATGASTSVCSRTIATAGTESKEEEDEEEPYTPVEPCRMVRASSFHFESGTGGKVHGGQQPKTGIAIVDDPKQFNRLVKRIIHPETGFKVQTRKSGLKNYKKCFVGSEAVDWMMINLHLENREEAVRIGNALIERGVAAHVNDAYEFLDKHIFYRFWFHSK